MSVNTSGERHGRRLRRRIHWFSNLLGLGTIALVGCKVGPDYKAPDQPMPAQWESPPTTQASITVQQPVEIERWWTTFHDPMLDSLEERAMKCNLSLEAATERVRAARASIGIAKAGLFPAVGSNASYSRSGGGGASTPSHNLWQAGLDAAWELDVFGGIQRSVEQANANLDAAVEDRRDVLVTLLGEVASDYIFLRGQQQEIQISHENLDVQVKNAALARDKQKLGSGTELDVVQADAQVLVTKTSIINFETSVQQTIYSLSVLLGEPPTALNNELRPQKDVPDPPPLVPVGLPSDLLRRRPDIRRAERQLAAATAGIGIATADLFPKFTLSGNVGIGATRVQGLGNIGNNFWSYGPGASWDIFQGGQIVSNIELQNAVTAQALTAYRSTVLAALQEVQNDLVAYAQEQHRREALSQAVTLNERAVVLSTHRYQAGQTDFLIVLDAERSLFASQDALVQSNQAVGTDAVALYKALGGGWKIEQDAATTQPVDR